MIRNLTVRTRWGVQWRSENRLDGITEHLIGSPSVGGPLTFFTRQQARDFIKSKYTYIKRRPDLRAEPHGWKMPRVVKVRISWRIVK